MGYFRIFISEILGASYSPKIYQKYEKLFLLVNRTRIESIKEHVENVDSTSWDVKEYFSESVPKKFFNAINDLIKLGVTRRRIIEDILKTLRLMTRGDEHRIIKVVPPEFLENILKLYIKDERKSYNSLVDGMVEDEKVYAITLSVIIKLILVNLFDKHINLGDTFDRGNGSDKLIKLYKAYFGACK